MRSRTGARPGRGSVRDDAGNAIIEFLAVTVLLLIPILYLVLLLGRLQAATFAADGAAAEAGRAYAEASTTDLGSARAVAAVAIALRDQGFDRVDPATSLELGCSSIPCLHPGSDVAATVRFAVRLPFVPSFVRSVVPLEIPVRGDAVAAVDQFRGQ
ncbi:MAG: pilus assembly protein [Cellulomonas sp.]|uniref:pilus assembly protein n=1 Tax=Cellulomonas sp. TaxID=40001 RepID=UPI0017B00A85|nr:pilus assembly protein [Cellulomonas sp.]NMM17589.1 pilus assembly protein [Cellulomonas sp.]NMM31444.1 pilus assembly protein [Cellulomonas sp.]